MAFHPIFSSVYLALGFMGTSGPLTTVLEFGKPFNYHPSIMSLPLLYPQALGNGRAPFKSPSLLPHFPPTYHGGSTHRFTASAPLHLLHVTLFSHQFPFMIEDLGGLGFRV